MNCKFNIAIRTDASFDIGTGHVMRCLTLAIEFRKHGATVRFICRELPGNFISFIEAANFKVFKLPCEKHYQVFLKEDVDAEMQQFFDIFRILNEVDLFIIDHYMLGNEWEKAVRPYVKKILVIDDFVNRFHDCDFLLDQNYPTSLHEKYKSLVPSHCQLLLGPHYALLREEFSKYRFNLSRNFKKISCILISMGGGDPTNITLLAMHALRDIQFSGEVEVVVGAQHGDKESIETFCKIHKQFQFHYKINTMAQLMSKANIAICASGSTTWERCCLGLPALSVTLADNQKHIAFEMQRLGIDDYLGEARLLKQATLIDKIKHLLDNPQELQFRSEAAKNLVDGLGVNRVVNRVMSYE